MLSNVALAFLLALAGPQDRPTVLDDVVVEGVRRDERTAFNFVQNLSAPPFGSRTMAVRTNPLCLIVENVRSEVANGIVDRISGRAQFVGLEVAEPGCRPNATIIFTADGAATASDIVQGNRATFEPTSGPTQLDHRSLKQFTEGDRAVRWWTVSMPVDAETGRRVVGLAGEHIVHYMTDPYGNIVTVQGGPPWREVRGIRPSGNNIQEALLHTVVVVDVRFTANAAPASLGDYLAMILLTQVDPDANLAGVPTILNLFSGNPTVTELSAWDLDYLTALYETPVEWSNIRFQQQDIARRMVAAAADPAGQ